MIINSCLEVKMNCSSPTGIALLPHRGTYLPEIKQKSDTTCICVCDEASRGKAGTVECGQENREVERFA